MDQPKEGSVWPIGPRVGQGIQGSKAAWGLLSLKELREGRISRLPRNSGSAGPRGGPRASGKHLGKQNLRSLGNREPSEVMVVKVVFDRQDLKDFRV